LQDSSHREPSSQDLKVRGSWEISADKQTWQQSEVELSEYYELEDTLLYR